MPTIGVALGSVEYTVGLVLFISRYLLWGIFIYYFIISMFGWVKRKETPVGNFPLKTKFAVVISAHNEELVIGGAIRSLEQVSYPKSMYDIFVIADNCDDNTARVARENGAKVFERFDHVKKGKGYSLEWMFKRLFELDGKYDAVCILDADNLVSSNFFMEMNKQLCMGNKVIQGYLDSKNPADSWVSGNYAIAYWISNRLFQLPRHYLGLSCALGGTGFVMSMDVLKDIGWGATCLTEDLEFSLKLIMKDMRVCWCHDAIVYDEKPLKISQSWKQRKRWMQGHFDCARKYLKSMATKAFKEKNMVAFDTMLYLVQPFVIAANGIGMLLGIIQFFILAEFDRFLTLNTLFFALLIVALTYFNIIFVLIEGKLSKTIVRYFLAFPLYSLTWVPIIIQGYINRNHREWVHTLHTRALDIADVETLKSVG